MISHTLIILRKEWMNFIRSDRSVFIVYFFLVFGWGMLLGFWSGEPSTVYAPLLAALFSVVVGVNFSNSAFVTERVTGALEILLTSGISRNGILFGKILFVVLITVLIGGVCFAISAVVQPLFTGAGQEMQFSLVSVIVFSSAAFLNAAGSAYLSVVLPNPRLLHFVTTFLIAGIMGAQAIAIQYVPLPAVSGAAAMILAGLLFTLLAAREWSGERIIKPVIL